MTCPATIPGGLLTCDLEQPHPGDHHDPDTGQHWAIQDDGRWLRFTIRGAGGGA